MAVYPFSSLLFQIEPIEYAPRLTAMVARLLLVVVLALQSQPAVPARDSNPRKTGSGAISGHITEQDSGQPLPRAIVTLIPADRSRRLEALADPQGRYEFTGLEPGKYALWASPGELRSTHLNQVFGQTDPMDLMAGPPGPGIELKPGEQRTGADIALARALAIEGRVSDSWDQPMADVEVHLTREDGTPYSTNPWGTYTDDRGAFRLFGLPPGRYRVCATPGGSFPPPKDTSRTVRTCHPASTGEALASDIVLTTADATGMDIRMQRSGTHSVSGSVLDASGTLAEGAHVGALPLDEHSAGAAARSRNGLFALTGLTPGRYILYASVGGPADPSDRRPPAREQERGYTSIDIETVDLTGVAVSLSKGQKVSGRVVFDGGSPPRPGQSRMVVQTRAAERPLDRLLRRPPFSPVNDRLGFELTGLYRVPLIVGIDGLPNGWAVKSVRYDGRDITDAPTDFGVESTPRVIEIVVTNRVAQPSVRVTDERGLPVTGYHVVLVPWDPRRWRDAILGSPPATSSDGVQQLGAKLPGEYLLAALSVRDFLVLIRDPTRIDDLAPVASRVRLAEGDSRTYELRLTELPPRR